MRKKKYENLFDKYPEYVSLEQLCQICKIAKRSGAYLIEHKIIPAIDTGRKTWRYKIAIHDVIKYLRQREQWGSMIPTGEVNSKSKRSLQVQRSFADMVAPNEISIVREYFEHVCSEYSDVLTSAEVAEITGLSKATVVKFIKDGILDAMLIGSKYIVPKSFLIDFVLSVKYYQTKSPSVRFGKVLTEFIESKSKNH